MTNPLIVGLVGLNSDIEMVFSGERWSTWGNLLVPYNLEVNFYDNRMEEFSSHLGNAHNQTFI